MSETVENHKLPSVHGLCTCHKNIIRNIKMCNVMSFSRKMILILDVKIRQCKHFQWEERRAVMGFQFIILVGESHRSAVCVLFCSCLVSTS